MRMLSRLTSIFVDTQKLPIDAMYLQNTQSFGTALSRWLPRQDGVVATHLSANERQMAIFYKNGATLWLDLSETRNRLHRMMVAQQRKYLSALSNPDFVQALDRDRLV